MLELLLLEIKEIADVLDEKVFRSVRIEVRAVKQSSKGSLIWRSRIPARDSSGKPTTVCCICAKGEDLERIARREVRAGRTKIKI